MVLIIDYIKSIEKGERAKRAALKKKKKNRKYSPKL
jgi:hypothetical protein